jgi:endonuclease/exonuclease/phosphatase family metal-dependent hydrolase
MAIDADSPGEAVILGGDFNLSGSQRKLLADFARDSGFVDVCDVLRCAQPDRIDRILVRESIELGLKPRQWSIDQRFRDDQGRALSDHLAVAVKIDWTDQRIR